MENSIVLAGVFIMLGLAILSWSIDRIADAYKERTKLLKELERERQLKDSLRNREP